jgi:hypothetical protein
MIPAMSQAFALALTLGLESLVGAVVLWMWGFRRRRSLLPLLALVLASSAITHPFAWQANHTWLRQLPFENRAAIIELTVVAVEAAVLWAVSQRIEGGRLRPGQALLLSLLSNATSFGVGLVIAYS